jgi:hypothetical protein
MRHMRLTLVVGLTFLGQMPREVSLLAQRPGYRVTQDNGSARCRYELSVICQSTQASASD